MSDTQNKNDAINSSLNLSNYSLGYNCYTPLPNYTSSLNSTLSDIKDKSAVNLNNMPIDITTDKDALINAANNSKAKAAALDFMKNKKAEVKPNIKTSNVNEAFIKNNGDIKPSYVKNDYNTGASINYSQVKNSSVNQSSFNKANNKMSTNAASPVNMASGNDRLDNAYKGAKRNKNKGCSGCLIFFILFIIFIIFLAGVSKYKGKSVNSSSSSYSEQKQSEKSSNSKISDNTANKQLYTYDKFKKITMGTNYNDVFKILGKETSKNSKDGETTYTYKNGDTNQSYILIYFSDDKVTGKHEYELTEVYSDITKAKYAKISKGMTYEQVKKLLGEGILTSEDKFGSESKSYTEYQWFKKDYGNIKLDFTDNKLTYSIAIGLN